MRQALYTIRTLDHGFKIYLGNARMAQWKKFISVPKDVLSTLRKIQNPLFIKNNCKLKI